MAFKTDSQTQKLIKQVKERKQEIAKIEKPNWKTNCSFSFIEGSLQNSTNLHVETSVRQLVCIASFLMDKRDSYKKAALHLEVDAPSFTWSSFSVEDWLDDIKARIDKIQITSKKKKLEELEARLNKLISPELKAELELEEIAKELE